MGWDREETALPLQNTTTVVPADSGTTRLHELGYKQELKRDLS